MECLRCVSAGQTKPFDDYYCITSLFENAMEIVEYFALLKPFGQEIARHILWQLITCPTARMRNQLAFFIMDLKSNSAIHDTLVRIPNSKVLDELVLETELFLSVLNIGMLMIQLEPKS